MFQNAFVYNYMSLYCHKSLLNSVESLWNFSWNSYMFLSFKTKCPKFLLWFFEDLNNNAHFTILLEKLPPNRQLYNGYNSGVIRNQPIICIIFIRKLFFMTFFKANFVCNISRIISDFLFVIIPFLYCHPHWCYRHLSLVLSLFTIAGRWKVAWSSFRLFGVAH